MLTILARVSDARAERLRGINSYFRESDPQLYVHMAIALAAILLIFLAIRLLYALQNRRSDIKAQPMALYLRVQSRMGFSLWDRWQMWRLAKATEIDNPTSLLISPVLFDRAVRRYVGSRNGCNRTERLSNIRKRLFGRAALLPIDPVAHDD